MTGKIKIFKPGFFSTIQDKGRLGYAKYGVPKSGAMDQYSYSIANLLLGNNDNAACIEYTFGELVLEFNETATIVLTGSMVKAFLNGAKLQMYKKNLVKKGDVISINSCKKGMYTYVGIQGGFLTPLVLNSRSFYKSITPEYRLKKNDEIAFKKGEIYSNQFSSISQDFLIPASNVLEVYEGPESKGLSSAQKSKLLSLEFSISNLVNRMAIQLNEQFSNSLPSMLSSPVLPGTVQLTPSGNIIVLMRDCQTTGGYSRIFQLTESSINKIAQKMIGEKVVFKVVDTI